MKDYSVLRGEQRQHLSLSEYAYNTVLSDSLAFEGTQNISGFINRIILNFWDSSFAFENTKSTQVEEQMRECLRKGRFLEKKPLFSGEIPPVASLSKEDEVLLRQLTRGQIYEERARLLSYPKDHTLKIRLRNNVYDLLYPDSYDEDHAGPVRSSYSADIKALIEDYSRRSYYYREAIYFKEYVDQITHELELPSNQRHILTIHYPAVSGGYTKYHVKPYCLTAESQGNYNYLIGLSAPAFSEEKQYQLAAFRLSRIKDIKTHAKSFGSGAITQKQSKEIETMIAKKGIAFLMAEMEHFSVLLTKEGISRFQVIAHLRPVPSEIEPAKDGSAIYHFVCTRRQMQYYFFQFGNCARILSPSGFAEEMKNMYEQAAKAYVTK